MNKIFSILALVGMIMTTACSNENNEPVIATDQASVTFSVNLDDIDSRVISDGTTVDQLIFAVYDAQGNEIEVLRQENVPVSNCHATVKTRVALGKKFTFAFWAQKSGNTFYNTTNLKDIVVSYTGFANDETRDAFTASWTIDKVTKDFTQEITLRRPFAQVDYVCTIEEWENLKNSTYQLLGSNLIVESGAFTHYNALTGEASVPTTTPIEFALPEDYLHTQSFDFLGFVTSKVNSAYQDLFTSTDGGNMFWLSMNYILATPEVTSLGKTTMNIYGLKNYDPAPMPIEYNELPIQRNHRTVVTVSNLTTQATLYIDIDASFSGDH